MDSNMWQSPLDDHSGQPLEDWEDWLRWEATSPEDGTVTTAASSKDDSPIQENALPVLGYGNKTLDDHCLVPPMILDVDSLDFAPETLPADETFLFGGLSGPLSAEFDTNHTTNSSFVPEELTLPNTDTDVSQWPLAPTTAQESVAISAIPTVDAPYVEALGRQCSPQSSTQVRTNKSSKNSESTSPKPASQKRGGRKRKADLEVEQHRHEDNGSGSQDGDEPSSKKTSHNVIEKRYRNNLNDKIVELRNSVPSLRAKGTADTGGGNENLEGLTPAHKLNKATVMGKATEYIKHLEKRNQTMADEMGMLRARLAAVEAAIGRPDDRHTNLSNSPASAFARSRESSSASQDFLSVPQDQPRYGQTMLQPQYLQPQAQPTYARQPHPPVNAQNHAPVVNGRGGGVANKLMMGAMAGIMVMEGFQQTDDDARSLAAVPGAVFRRGLDFVTPTALPKHATLPLVKIMLVIGCFIYLLTPLLTTSRRHPPPKMSAAVRLPYAPSLASPVGVRRKAWLTAMQSVYVPKHFLLEVIHVLSKMAILSTRRLIGSKAYNTLTNTNKEEEAARLKAWDIAIDAQLAGGDAEVSYYRLLLTLMASGTLPDTPTRLMQKAVHFRVFFWDVANAGYGNIFGFRSITEKVGRVYWDSARRLQKELLQAQALGRSSAECEGELLPDHLASLLELDCDEVLTDEMIQRAWNLAWNKSSAHALTPNAAKDSVVEDHAIRSPLDAIGAWYANTTVDDTLVDVLGEYSSCIDTEYYIALAISIAPPASATHARALTAKAILCSRKRESNIVAALEALPMRIPAGPGTVNLVNHLPASPDVRTALTLAKLSALLMQTQCVPAKARAHSMLAGLHLAPGSFTLLSAVAAYRVLRIIQTDPGMSVAASLGAEELAASLRLWIGTSAGRRIGLERDGYGRVVDLCLTVAKKAGGWEEKDSGYGSTASREERTAHRSSRAAH